MRPIPSSYPAALRVRCDLQAGAIVCYDNTGGVLTPVWTPCSTGGVIPPVTPPPSVPSGVQWLDCVSCTGTLRGAGQLGPARCEVCYTR